MGWFENNRLTEKERDRATSSVRSLIRASVDAEDGRRWGELDPDGQVRTGLELGKRPKDAAWWVAGSKRRKLWDDWGRFRAETSDALDRYGLENRYRELWADVGEGLAAGARIVGGVAMVATGLGAATGVKLAARGVRESIELLNDGGPSDAVRDVAGFATSAAAAADALVLGAEFARAVVREVEAYRQHGTPVARDGALQALWNAKKAGRSVKFTKEARGILSAAGGEV